MPNSTDKHLTFLDANFASLGAADLDAPKLLGPLSQQDRLVSN